MTNKTRLIFQFKITLLEIKPSIWRRIQVVESYTFWDLHVAIQDAMGWQDCHLHEFNLYDPQNDRMIVIGIPGFDEFSDRVTSAGWSLNIRDFFSLENPRALYDYDFGDDWRHTIELEDILSRDELPSKFPKCLDGARACPPEDCGGAIGYERLVKAMRSPQHEDYKMFTDWLGDVYKADDFDPHCVRFDNPRKRWRTAFDRN